MINRTPVQQFGMALLAVACALPIAGCKKEKISSYEVPKESSMPVTRSAADANAAAQLPPMPKGKIDWATLPDGWSEASNTSQMRIASFSIKGDNGEEADLSVIPLPELAGRETEFVNMWREQIQLPHAAPDEISKMEQNVKIGNLDGQMFDMVSTAPIDKADAKSRILVAMASQAGMSWFFKMTGADQLVENQKSNFVKFLAGVTLHGEPAATVDPHAGMNMAGGGGSMPVMPALSAPNAPSAGTPKWTVPADWTSTDPGSMMLAKWDVPGGGAEVSVLALGGTGGGMLMNINRWRGQLQLPPTTDAELPSLTKTVPTAGTTATVVDMTGGGKRMVAMIVPLGGQTWFYKCMGDPDAVGKTKDAFLQFAESAQY